jgi:hypothetical protein
MNLTQQDVLHRDSLLLSGTLTFQMRSSYFRYHKPDKTREKSELIENKGMGHPLPNMDGSVANGPQQPFHTTG